MSENVPKWITDLALDIYNVIQKYNALPRFQEMVNKWGIEHEAKIERHNRWQEERNTHFEKNVATNPRFQDEKAGPPEEGWKWETHVLHVYEETKSGPQRTSKIITGWVPPELLISVKPEITYILPLSREHKLSLDEKYALLTAIYNCGCRGTEEIALWKWPRPDAWNEPSALSNARKSIFFVGLCDGVSELTSDTEGWLRSFLGDVEKDITFLRAQIRYTQEAPIQTSSIRKSTITRSYKSSIGKYRLREILPASLIFISYSREDRNWLVDIREALDPLIRQKKIRIWTDENIEPGKEFRPEIEDAIHFSKGALLLVSRHYLASNFINNVEIPHLLDAREKRGLKILWILVGGCMWEETFLKDIQAAIEPNTALNNLPEGERDISIKRVAEVIRDTFAKKDDQKS